MRRLEFQVETSGERLDRYLVSKCQELSRSYLQKLIKEAWVRVNGALAKPSLRLEAGDQVSISLPPPEPLYLQAESLPLTVVYEDQDLLVVDKPAGLPVHPAPGHPAHTLVNALLAHCPDLSGIGGRLRPGIVHRLDKDTSGLMVVAKNDRAHQALSRQIKERQLFKAYLALVEGHLSPPEALIEAPIARHPVQRQRMAVVESGREARTRYRVITYLDRYSYLEVFPETGRTHQVRVHFSALGHPLFGDSLYGRPSPLLKRHFLHAHRLGFCLPLTSEYREFRSELPPDLEELLERLSAK